MKKGLLSLLALALTVVGCQNYDDQFAELTSQITDLQSTVDGLTGVSSSLTTLQSTVAGIQSAIAALPTTDSVADLSGLNAQLDTISSTLAALQASLANVVTAEDLATISNTLGDVEADVHELLTGSSAISQDVIITTAAELEYMETVIETGENSPSGYIVTGNVTVSHDNLDAGQITRANALTAKLITVIGNVDVDGAVDLATLAYIQGDYIVADTDALEPLLRNLTGDLSINGQAGAIDYSALATIGGNVTISNTASVTSLNFNGTNIGGNLNGGVITVNNATDVNIGGATITQLTANSADNITLGQTNFAATTVITATNEDATVNITGTGATAELTIVVTGTADVNVSAMTSAATLTITNAENINFGGLTSVTGPIDADAATDNNFNSLANLGGNSTFDGTNVSLGALASTASGTLTVPDQVALSLPMLVNTSALSAAKATSLVLKSSSVANLTAGVLASLEVTAQSVPVTLTAAADLSALTSLDVTGKNATVATNITVAVSRNTTLTDVSVDGVVKSLIVTSTGDLDTITTGGKLTTLDIDAADLTSLTIGHSFISGDLAPEVFITNTDLGTVNMSTIEKVKTVNIQNNTSLTSITPPSSARFAEPAAPVTVVLGTNSLTAVYTAGSAYVSGTQTTSPVAAVQPVIASSVVRGMLDWILLATADTTAATSTSINIANVTHSTPATVTTLAAAITADANSGVATSPISTKAVFDLVTN